jgi:hypothetical protein
MHVFQFDSKFRPVSLEELNVGNNIHGDGEPIKDIPGIMRNQGLVERGYDIISGIFVNTINPNIILWVSMVAVTPAGMVEMNVKFNHEDVVELTQKPAFKNWFGNKKTEELVEQSARANQIAISKEDKHQFNSMDKANQAMGHKIIQLMCVLYKKLDSVIVKTIRSKIPCDFCEDISMKNHIFWTISSICILYDIKVVDKTNQQKRLIGNSYRFF